MYVVTVLFEVASADAEAFRRRVLQQSADSLRAEPGCHRFDVAVDPEAPGRIYLYELYDDRAAFDAHLASAHFKSFDADVAPMVGSKRVETFELARGAAD